MTRIPRPLLLLLIALAFGCGQRDRTAADPGAILTARTLGLAYLEENRLEEASSEFVKLIRLAPDEPSGYANLGLVYLRLGRYEQAAREIDRALKLAPDDPEIRLLQATVLQLTGRTSDAGRTLESTLKNAPDHLKTLYALAELGDSARRREYLIRLVAVAPANAAARFTLAAALLQAGDINAARDQLELLRQRLPRLPPEADRFYTALLADVQANRLPAARTALAPAKRFLETTPVYQAGMTQLRGPAGQPPGYPVLTLSARLALAQRDPRAVVNAIRFNDVSAAAGISSTTDSQVVAAAGDFDGDQDVDLLVVSHGDLSVYRNDLSRFTMVKAGTVQSASRSASSVAIGDYDNDGHLDVYVAGALLRNNGDGTFRERLRAAGEVALLADFDHDGDLDLFLGAEHGDQLYRNNSDGTFQQQGLGTTGTTSAAFGDFAGDARIDVITAGRAGLTYSRGLEGGRFEAVARSGLEQAQGSVAVAAGDYDNDGFLDLFAAGFFKNDATGRFTHDTRARAPASPEATAAAFLDFDNDGWLDLIQVGRSAVRLLHNDQRGRFTDRSALLPAGGARQVISLDHDDDGDLDLLLIGLDGRLRLLRNDGGNANQFVNVQLVALRDGSGKNNSMGIGSRLELRAGDLYQMRVVDQPVMHFGLGNRLKADVLRVLWTNGVPQSFYYPVDQAVLEDQILKGSCAFLYTWDGERYRFVTDVLWGSALGMPLGIMASGRMAYGPAHATREYFRIPGEQLKPARGRYRLQITEELWEVAYVDQLALLAVDHPDSVQVFVDERFVPPGSPGAGELTIHQVVERRPLRSATDERGRDLLPALRAKDDVYVGGFVPGPYQGITQTHDLILDLGDLPPDQQNLRLLLQGWILPTDASINVAISQSQTLRVVWPSLAVRDAAGHWRTVIDNLSFPAGKDKTVIVDLSGKFLTADRRVRIRTNMEIYWDHAFVATDLADQAAVRVTPLQPIAADLHARGFSRMFRKGGRYGPQWPDYDQVLRQSPWLPIPGRYTRYGDVVPLIGAADDAAVIMAPGDEVTVEFPESGAPALPKGWRRDFLLFNVNWMKDADLHTATGHSVEPLPFRAMTRYPYGPAERYPDDSLHRRYVAEYNTRRIGR